MPTHDSERNDAEHDAGGAARDAVSRYLRSRGVSDRVRRMGLRDVVAQWEAIAQTAARYDLTLDDWLNDLDLRDIVAGAFAAASPTQRDDAREALDRADALFRAGTVETDRSLWGDAVALADEHDPKRQWWYFRRPANPGDSMRADLISAGIA